MQIQKLGVLKIRNYTYGQPFIISEGRVFKVYSKVFKQFLKDYDESIFVEKALEKISLISAMRRFDIDIYVEFTCSDKRTKKFSWAKNIKLLNIHAIKNLINKQINKKHIIREIMDSKIELTLEEII